MKVRLCTCLFAAALSAVWSSESKAVLIPTNYGKGADVDMREEQYTTPDFGGNFTGVNRNAAGSSANELGTRVSQGGTPPAGTQSSLFYAKFDIGDLPARGDAYWTVHQTVAFDLFPGANNNFQISPASTDLAGNPTDLKFSIRALDPNGNYPGSAATRRDRVNLNDYTSPNYVYDWAEGNGTTGINFYDAPGITPFCMNANNCGGAAFDSTKGAFDDFDSNTIYLGDLRPELLFPGTATVPIGTRMTFSNDALREVVLDAIDAGKDTVTLIVNVKDPRADMPQASLGRNFVLWSKERPNQTVGMVVYNNADGRYSPTLRINVPEPTSLVLVGLAAIAGLIVRKRS
jgi:hypothetical protein